MFLIENGIFEYYLHQVQGEFEADLIIVCTANHGRISHTNAYDNPKCG
ncbi:MAG: hypothetical protein Q8M06_05695 [Methanobacteriaceae archaeon]|nr:hypothetical protein [Methanobacteriaceae archaeon]